MQRTRLAVVASALGLAVALVSATGSASTAPLLPCKSSQLSLSAPGGSVAIGGIFSFTDTSSRPCTLQGWPTFSAREPSGRMALQRIVRGGITASTSRPGPASLRKTPVVLKPGHTAEFAVTWTTRQPSQYCLNPPTIVVKATPPGNAEPLGTRLHVTGSLCGPITVGFVALVIPFG